VKGAFLGGCQKRINLLFFGARSRLKPLLEPGGVPGPMQRKFGPIDPIKEKPHPLGLNKKFEELPFEIFVRGGVWAKQSITPPTD